jgi:hypothetical protein
VAKSKNLGMVKLIFYKIKIILPIKIKLRLLLELIFISKNLEDWAISSQAFLKDYSFRNVLFND